MIKIRISSKYLSVYKYCTLEIESEAGDAAVLRNEKTNTHIGTPKPRTPNSPCGKIKLLRNCNAGILRGAELKTGMIDIVYQGRCVFQFHFP